MTPIPGSSTAITTPIVTQNAAVPGELTIQGIQAMAPSATAM